MSYDYYPLIYPDCPLILYQLALLIYAEKHEN